jgi:N-methylhydantoinase A/oxoprolinase/acetone carboxylase beta subunit
MGASAANVTTHRTNGCDNALLQGSMDGHGLIITTGFRHILEIAHEAVPHGYRLDQLAAAFLTGAPSDLRAGKRRITSPGSPAPTAD